MGPGGFIMPTKVQIVRNHVPGAVRVAEPPQSRMVRLENINTGAKVRGLVGPSAVEIARTEWIGADALKVVYRGTEGPAEVLLFRDAEPLLELVQASRSFSSDGDGRRSELLPRLSASGSLICSIPI